MIGQVNPVLLDKLMESLANKKISKWYKAGFKLVGIVDTDGFVLYASENTKCLLDIDPHEIIGTYAFDLVHKDDLNKTIEKFSEILVKKKPTETDVTIKSVNGWISVHVKAVPIVRMNRVVAIVTLSGKNSFLFGEVICCFNNGNKKCH